MDGVTLYATFLHLHRPQLVASGIPEHYWEVLHRKLCQQIFDASEALSLMIIEYDNRTEEDPITTVVVHKEDGVRKDDPQHIYIVDHAWTFRLDTVRSQLRQIPGLLVRMANIMGVDNDQPEDDCIEQVSEKMWKYCQMYSIGADGLNIESQMPIWYIPDELGCGVNHSDTPNFRLVPFMFMPEQITYSVLFPIEDCEEGTIVTRDYVEGNHPSADVKKALMLPWKNSSFTHISFQQKEPSEEYFLDGHIEESLPAEVSPPVVDPSRPLKVFTTYIYIRQYLNDPLFELVDDENDADILWLTTHFKTFNELSTATPNRFINQFPFENVLTIKDLLAAVCRRVQVDQRANESQESLKTFPNWLPTTFNLKTELLEFVSYFQRRAEKGLDNHWIVKPWNLARGLDTHITDNVGKIMRLQPTGPKIAQKYIENPVLFDRPEVGGKVKFDVRYVILLSSVDPLDAYIYRNFFLRFANKPFALNRFDDYQQHFTVMNYNEQVQLRHIPCKEFLEMWNVQYPDSSWMEIENGICDMLKEVLIAATMKKPPSGIGKCKQGRALYAADIMLEWENGKMAPKLLEINWTPDCKRACEYYPDFYNNIFKLLFLNQMNDSAFRKITL
ncbi:tubulin--tyrosine ligase-like protein 12 [Bradysia coprophila]|uniref:tubulin--tyrosine ligase-like protein 12 n=1 Tax=Bradysia coprophila TaxID=38358 RepID=UPI00187D8BB6|nr:tubulin--tyrosine ligase-like protein 12 [Bradysia coprophila]XP_037044333.1 tubulin--tyrosine ligase-like protein 12 [Bradysia coprophila]